MKKLKVFNIPWHSTHQYSLMQMPFIKRWDLLIEPWRKGYAESQRPAPPTMNYVTHFTPNEYDFCLLHVDQQSIYDPDHGDRISKGRLFNEVKETVEKLDPNLPIIVINHMTPFHDKYESDYVVKKIKEMVGSHTMICNSYEAQKQWGWGEVITHGLNPDEWGYDVAMQESYNKHIDLPKEPRCVIVLSPAGMEKAYRRIFAHNVVRILEDAGIIIEWVGITKKFKDYNSYRDFLGRSLVFFNPTWQSPRPRARTEAMLSGCCVVTTRYHDADTFIEDGVNGFLTSRERIQDPRIMDNPEYTANMIIDLIHNNPDRAIEVGKKGQETARQLFNKEVFDKQWEDLLIKLNILK